MGGINFAAIFLQCLMELTALALVMCALFIITLALKKRHTKKNLSSSFTLKRDDPNYSKLVADVDMKTFDDIVGHTGVKEELKKFMQLFTDKKMLESSNIELPRGLLLYGPPGCGKTLLAKAVAREANMNFICRNAADLVSNGFGMLGSESGVTKLFNEARSLAPCIVFIDELDILSERFTGGSAGSHQADVTRLLAEMDGFRVNDGILVIGATNDIGRLDAALLRSGRFGRKFYIGAPSSKEDILALVNMYSSGKNFSDTLTPDVLATVLQNLSPADIKEILNRCGADALMSGTAIDRLMIEQAIIELNISTNITKDTRGAYLRKLAAWHEAGHAVLAKKYGYNVSSISIYTSATGIGGITSYAGTDRGSEISKLSACRTTKGVLKRLAISYGGLCGELLLVGGDKEKLSLGATQDLRDAFELAFGLATGFPYWSEHIIAVEPKGLHGKAFDARMDETFKLLSDAQDDAMAVVTANKEVIAHIAEVLVDRYIVMDEDAEELLKDIV